LLQQSGVKLKKIGDITLTARQKRGKNGHLRGNFGKLGRFVRDGTRAGQRGEQGAKRGAK
jgi:hypothetical protein